MEVDQVEQRPQGRAGRPVAVEGAAEAGADTQVIDLKRLDLPFYTSEHGISPSARRLADTVQAADALLWSSPTYHGSTVWRVVGLLWVVSGPEGSVCVCAGCPVSRVRGMTSLMDGFTVRAVQGSPALRCASSTRRRFVVFGWVRGSTISCTNVPGRV